ncbi:MAG: cell division protein [Alphaproteobacteria bacterium]|nr:cell division protein [Alphaproteobacteria bacterium]
MIGRRSDLPLAKDSTGRFLPLLVALMVFLSAVAVAGVIVLEGMIHRWDRDVAGTLTVQVTPAAGNPAESARLTDERVNAAIAVLQATPGVASSRALPKDELLALLQPWLGSMELLRDLPLPRLVDVTLDQRAHVDVDALALKVGAVPGASLDDHRVWLSRLIAMSRTIEWLAMGALALISAVTSATVIYATRTGMEVHREVIDVLHLVGAQDDYVARQFADRAFTLGLRGGALGLALAIPAFVAVSQAGRRLEGGFVPDLSLPVYGWALVMALPLVAAFLAMMTARITVHGTLSRLP